ncbi:uncharacterized protein PHACADRAFT_97239 [Phanerochaete carnosa HHB-10118-sp]|uniref:Glucose-methanol-choline oxidoreductase C-terminal domain-containing protein n=1 Tax=Phanerochaete carnosa (strain HHB-10118-sp) TaxID=650164 RepID=K5W6T4_PHACS|nr:uncharacterized protein PHACADRAFT_97239 [Phanerochaete carnosa HHB-10118-sp]EKM54669.1 hypothetical protein PHACADRAFT_97239 [Phanerochaete carnosa HHB-10118-sp]
MLPAVLRPHSRGTIRLCSLNPLDPPLMELNFLSAPADRKTLRTAVRLCMRIAGTMHANGYGTRPLRAPRSAEEADVDEYIDATGMSFLHYSSTCRMAPRDDPEPGVVDDELRVHGIANLRVCDASVFPQIPAAHLLAPVVVVAEKCAEMIKKAVGGIEK